MHNFRKEVVESAITYLMQKINLQQIQLDKLLLLLWLADRLNLRTTGKLITNDDYIAHHTYGVIPGKTLEFIIADSGMELDNLENYIDGLYRTPDTSTDFISDSSKDSIDIIVENFGNKSQHDLFNMCRNYPDYTQTIDTTLFNKGINEDSIYFNNHRVNEVETFFNNPNQWNNHAIFKQSSLLLELAQAAYTEMLMVTNSINHAISSSESKD